MNIGFNIKKLRRERDITQEQLAEYLNISVSAISQWECGKTTPDISLLAPLANIFDVSSDVLLGIDVVNKEKQIGDIIVNAEKYRSNDIDKTLSILREGLKEYPNSYNIMERLTNYYIWLSKHEKPADEELVLSNEIIKLGEKILAECTDDRIRLWALHNLCSAYQRAGMTEKAIELAEKLPHTIVTRESLLANLYDGEKKIKQIKDNILYHFERLITNMENYNEIEKDIIIDKKIVSLIEAMIEDKNYGYFWLSMYISYLTIAKDYVKSNDYDKAIESLQLSSDNAIKLDTDYAGANHVYTSMLLKGAQARIAAINLQEGFSKRLLEAMKDTAFDPIREKKAFIEIEEKLKKYAKNKD